VRRAPTHCHVLTGAACRAGDRPRWYAPPPFWVRLKLGADLPRW